MNFSWPVKLKASFGALISRLFPSAGCVCGGGGVVRTVVGLPCPGAPCCAGSRALGYGTGLAENDNHSRLVLITDLDVLSFSP